MVPSSVNTNTYTLIKDIKNDSFASKLFKYIFDKPSSFERFTMKINKVAH